MRTFPFLLIPRIMLALLLLLTGMANAQTSKPAIPLDGDWKFQRDPDDQGIAKGWQNADFDDSAWGTMKVPGDWGDDVDGIGWYRKKVNLPSPAPKNLMLVFRGADDKSDVYLNGKLAVQSHSYSTPFHVNPVPFANADGSLQIAVRVTDRGGPGGLIKPVEFISYENPGQIYETELSAKTPPHTLDELGSLVLYSVYTRNFSQEGTFKALQNRLPELKKLGVNILWLLPIHEIGVEKRKGPDGSPYAIKDYYSVDPALGTKDDFKALVKAAHEQGMKLIIDCVLNHTSPDSVWAAQHPEWFLRDENGKPRPMNLDWSDVVDLDWKNKTVWEETTKMMEYWVKEFDIDGYRCDVADRMPDPFWAQARARLDKLKPGIVMLAESGDANRQLNGFDIVYSDGIRDVMHDIAEGKATAAGMRDEINSQIYGNPKGSVRMLFIENHDKPRAINFFPNPDQVKAAAVLTATLPGVPLLYTGTEIGANADRNDTFFTRTPVDWSTDPNHMRDFWTDLLKTRAAHSALQKGSVKIVEAEPADQVLAFKRESDHDKVLVIVNLSGKPVSAKIKDENFKEDGQLPPWGWKISGLGKVNP